MSPLFYILSVALGGAGGALFREFLSRELNGRTKFPAGTFTANMLASFLTGVAVGLQSSGILPESAYPLVDIGFCATLSTFSALAWEIAEMIKSKKNCQGRNLRFCDFCIRNGTFFYCFGNFDKMEFLKELPLALHHRFAEILTLPKKSNFRFRPILWTIKNRAPLQHFNFFFICINPRFVR